MSEHEGGKTVEFSLTIYIYLYCSEECLIRANSFVLFCAIALALETCISTIFCLFKEQKVRNNPCKTSTTF